MNISSQLKYTLVLSAEELSAIEEALRFASADGGGTTLDADAQRERVFAELYRQIKASWRAKPW